jgi:hypothetical protein
MPMSIKCQKHEKKMTINVIQHDDSNGAFSIASKNDIDNQNVLLATVHIYQNIKFIGIFVVFSRYTKKLDVVKNLM